MKKYVSIFILFWQISGLYSQEVLISQPENVDAKLYYLQKTNTKKAVDYDTIPIPIIDDFSDSQVEPKPSLWADKRAYINNRYSLNPVTAGIATLDAYDFNGAPYSNASTSPYIADYLTSLPVDLAYPASDNIYLSFYYQAKGIGEQPGPQDSLCLEFYSTDSLRWDRVWSVPGSPMTVFKNVMIPILDEQYLKKGFRFRFLNYATLPPNPDYEDEFSNFDHWHIDYVKLDRNRSVADTVLHDVSFVSPVSSILKNYESIPWEHMKEAYFTQRSPTISTSIVNLDNITRNVTKYIRIKDLETGTSYKTIPTANDFAGNDLQTFSFDYDYSFNFDSPSPAIFEISSVIETDAFDYKNNDTIRRKQVFSNYYAYDDGSAEYGYGLSAQGTSNAMVAVRFHSFKPDSLRAVDMYFNQVKDSINLNFYFYLNVWKDNGGKPGDLVYSKLGERPRYSSKLNQFVRYELDSAIFIQGDFYIGWKKTVDKLSNIGFDLNNNNRLNNFYNLGPGWTQSMAQGSIMIRPVISSVPLQVNTVSYNPVQDFRVFPNPADRFIDLGILPAEEGRLIYTIFDMTGKKIRHQALESNEIDVSGIPSGIYLLRVAGIDSSKIRSCKIIIQH